VHEPKIRRVVGSRQGVLAMTWVTSTAFARNRTLIPRRSGLPCTAGLHISLSLNPIAEPPHMGSWAVYLQAPTRT
jgi:hypothetical protein